MRDQHLIIVPFHLPWEWSADYQRQTCLELAKNHFVIAYIRNDARFTLKSRPKHTFPKLKNIVFYQPRYLLPFRRFAWIERANQLICVWYLMVRYGWKKPKTLLWIFDPVFWFYPTLRYVWKRVVSIYDCVDYMWSRDPLIRRETQRMEERLIRRADYFIVNSHILANLHQKQRQADAIVPQGFRYNDFRRPHTSKHLFGTSRNVVGYVGAINHRMNFDLIHSLAQRCPDAHFVFWGRIQETEEIDLQQTKHQIRRLLRFPNVTVGHSEDTRELPAIIAQFSVAIIPYDTSQDGIRYCYPMKLFEYFYMGKPVISTPIVELRRYPRFVNVGSTVGDWERLIRELLRTSWPKKYQQEQRRFALANSWKRKITAIFSVVGV